MVVALLFAKEGAAEDITTLSQQNNDTGWCLVPTVKYLPDLVILSDYPPTF